jgi:hypothetical protein
VIDVLDGEIPQDRAQRILPRRQVYRSIDELQADLDLWIRHQGRWCFGKIPMQIFLDAMPMTKEKMIAA